jgi:hypothetical protein
MVIEARTNLAHALWVTQSRLPFARRCGSQPDLTNQYSTPQRKPPRSLNLFCYLRLTIVLSHLFYGLNTLGSSFLISYPLMLNLAKEVVMPARCNGLGVCNSSCRTAGSLLT